MGIHFRNDPRIIEAIIKKRGRKWYKDLEKKSREKRASFTTVKYYEKKIQELQKEN